MWVLYIWEEKFICAIYVKDLFMTNSKKYHFMGLLQLYKVKYMRKCGYNLLHYSVESLE